MKKEDIESLIEKYYKGESSLQEEKELREFFSSNMDAVNEYKDAALFQAFQQERNMEPENLIIEADQFREKNRFEISSGLLKIAAIVLIVLGTLVVLIPWDNSKYSNNQQPTDSFSDPNEALIEAKKALAMVSIKMKTGRNDAAGKVSKFKEVLPLKK